MEKVKDQGHGARQGEKAGKQGVRDQGLKKKD
jgi:hypothetical protein